MLRLSLLWVLAAEVEYGTYTCLVFWFYFLHVDMCVCVTCVFTCLYVGARECARGGMHTQVGECTFVGAFPAHVHLTS